MSTDIYANPDLSKKVRYSTKEQEDGAEWEQREVEIYESTGGEHSDCQSQGGEAQPRNLPPVQKGFRYATVGLTVLCLLLLAGIIILSICFALNNSHHKTEYNDLSNDYTQLQEEIKQLNNNNNKEGKCPDGWTRFGCSCYYKSSVRKTWFESRADCKERGADLVSINSNEEQKFVSELNKKGESWIGLQARFKEKFQWEWVDGSPLTEMFWAQGQQDPTELYSAVYCDKNGKWTASRFSPSKSWICEK